MSTIANAKVEHNYNRYNGYFFGCLHSDDRREEESRCHKGCFRDPSLRSG